MNSKQTNTIAAPVSNRLRVVSNALDPNRHPGTRQMAKANTKVRKLKLVSSHEMIVFGKNTKSAADVDGLRIA